MFDLVVRGDLVLPDRVLEDGYLAILGRPSAPSALGQRRRRKRRMMPRAS